MASAWQTFSAAMATNSTPPDAWFTGITNRFPWILEKGRDCIISPDCDGMLCGLLMSHFLDWRIRGFYDGKVLAVARGVNWEECVFLDMEIFRKDVKSVGQHMLLFNGNREPANWHNFDSCISPNNLRGFDKLHNFKRKYPLGTIHLLMAILSAGGVRVKLPDSAFVPLIYVDGVFKNILNYPENCLDWLETIGFEDNCLNSVFCGRSVSLRELMGGMREFFDDINDLGKRADKIVISDRNGDIVNLRDGALSGDAAGKAGRFLSLLGKNTKWKYAPDAWQWQNLKVAKCGKTVLNKPNTGNFNKMVESKRPFSWAITSAMSVEMTVAGPVFKD